MTPYTLIPAANEKHTESNQATKLEDILAQLLDLEDDSQGIASAPAASDAKFDINLTSCGIADSLTLVNCKRLAVEFIKGNDEVANNGDTERSKVCIVGHNRSGQQRGYIKDAQDFIVPTKTS